MNGSYVKSSRHNIVEYQVQHRWKVIKTWFRINHEVLCKFEGFQKIVASLN